MALAQVGGGNLGAMFGGHVVRRRRLVMVPRGARIGRNRELREGERGGGEASGYSAAESCHDGRSLAQVLRQDHESNGSGIPFSLALRWQGAAPVRSARYR